MRIRLSQLRRIIKEEVSRVINENEAPVPPDLERKEREAREAFSALKGSYEHLVKYASKYASKDDQVEKINVYFNKVVGDQLRGEPLYGPRDSINMGSEALNMQVWLLVNGAVKLGPVELGSGLKLLKSFDAVGKYIDEYKDLAVPTPAMLARWKEAEIVNRRGAGYRGE